MLLIVKIILDSTKSIGDFDYSTCLIEIENHLKGERDYLKSKSIVLSVSLTMLLSTSCWGISVNAATTTDKTNSVNFTIENNIENAKIVQMTSGAAIFDPNGQEIGTINKDAILVVKDYNDEMFEIIVDTMVFPSINERLFIKKTNFIETSSEAITICESCGESNLIEEEITFDKGAKLLNITNSSIELISFKNSTSFTSYYKVENNIVVKFNDQYFYIVPSPSEAEKTPETETSNILNKSTTDSVGISAESTTSTQLVETPESIETQEIKIDSFKPTDKYFEAAVDNITVYDNSGGTLKPVGSLKKGQIYPRIADYGDWHQIKFGNKFGYVWADSTKVASGTAIKNENKGLSNTSRTFRAIQDTTVYDNTSGSLVPFFTLESGQEYPIIANWGEWLQVDVAGRIGFVYAPAVSLDFTSNDKYFEVISSNVTVYDNSRGGLVPVGTLEKGQVYPRVSDYGDWHQIRLGNGFGYVWEDSTTTASGNTIKNQNKGQINSARTFKATQNTTVYDNTSGSLVPFYTINRGEKYPLIADWGDWLLVDVAGRIGFVYKPVVFLEFLPNDKYFEVTTDNLTIYDNSGNGLVPIGSLTKGQIYPRVADYGDWHQIKFGNKYGYVWEEASKVASGSQIKNENKGLTNSPRTFKVLKSIEVYDNTSGSLVPYAKVNYGELYPIIADYGDWLQVDVSGRIGFVYKDNNYIHIGPTVANTYRSYNYSFNQLLTAQMAVVPQTDLYQNLPAYVSKEFVTYKNDENHKPGYYVTADKLFIREKPTNESGTYIYGSFKYDDQVSVLKEVNGWYQIIYTWRNAKEADTAQFLDPNANSKYQHLRLDILGEIPTQTLDAFLSGRGILSGKGQAFKEAALRYGVNEAYLVSHASLETNKGRSDLSIGVPIKVNNGVVTIVDPAKETPQMRVYNMYGIGALDKCPLQCGAQTAYDKGWDTPEKAIIFGAEFVKNDYIGLGQNTLYKMRWNPDFIDKYGRNRYPELNSAQHQYATDIGWAVKQTMNIESIYQQLDYYNAMFDFPVFK
jgi:mannosyl-glycoprotein endo-beta-N-acetylglucosaminidase